MRIINSMLRQKALYWAPGRKDKYGEPILSNPVEIKCRWEDALSLDIGPNMQETVFASTVYVGTDVKVGKSGGR